MRKFYVAIAVLLAALAIGIAIGPRFVDWGRYRTLIATRLAAATGLELRIDGAVSLTLLPSARLQLTDVALVDRRNGPSGAPDLMQARAIDISVALGPLLAGRIEPQEVAVIDPVVDVAHLPAIDVDAMLRDLAGGAPADGFRRLAIGRLSIVGGTIRYDAAGGAERLDHLSATASPAGLRGGLRLDGSFTRHGHAFTIAGRVAPGGGDGKAIPLTLDIEAVASGASLRFDGAVAPAPPSLGGQLVATGKGFAATAEDLGIADAATLPSGPFALAGRFAVDAAGMQLTAIEARLGETRAGGTARLAFGAVPRFAVSLTLPELDLDRLAPGAVDLGALDLGGLGRGSAAILSRLTLPAGGWSGSLEATVDAVTWHGQLIRHLGATADVDGGRLAGATLSALLPGGGQASIDATFTRTPDLRAAGTLKIGADDLRSLLRAAGVAIPNVPEDHLRRAALAARFTAGVDGLALAEIDLDLDASHATGSASVALGPRPSVTAHLVADTLNLDGYLPPDLAARGLAALWQAVRDVDFDLDATVGAMVLRGRPLRRVHVAARETDGVVTIADARLSEIGGATADLSGTIGNLAAALPTIALHFAAEGKRLAPVLLPEAGGWLADALAAPFSASGTIATADGVIDMTGRVALLGAIGTVDGTVTPGPVPRIAARVALDDPSYAQLLQALDLGIAAEQGPVKLAARLSGTASALSLDQVSLTIGGQSVSGHAALALAGAAGASATLAAGTLTLDSLVPRGGALAGLTAATIPRLDPGLKLEFVVAADRLAYGGVVIDHPRLTLAIGGGAAAATDLTAGLFGGTLGGSLALVSGAPVSGAPDTLKLSLRLDHADLHALLTDDAGAPVAIGRVSAEVTAGAAGDTLAALAHGLAGSASIRSDAGALVGIDLHALAAATAAPGRVTLLPGLLQAALHGSTRFTALTGHFAIADAVARCSDLTLALDGGAAHGSLAVELADGSLSGGAELQLAAPATAPPVMLLLSGPSGALRRSFDLSPIEAYAKAHPPHLQ